MSTYNLYKTVAFLGRPGLATVGYLLAGGSRITVGVAEVLDGSGNHTAVYGATIAVPIGYEGPILWDSGEATPAYAGDEINPVNQDARGTGASSVTLTVNDGTNPVPGALVTIKDMGETQILAGPLPTNSSGQVAFNLADGTYHILVQSGPAYATLAAQTLVVSGTTTHTYSLTPFGPGVPASAALCRVYGWLYRPDGTPAGGSSITFKLVGGHPLGITPEIIAQAVTVTVDADQHGYFEADLIQSGAMTIYGTAAGDTQYQVNCPDAGMVSVRQPVITVPAANSALLTSLLPTS